MIRTVIIAWKRTTHTGAVASEARPCTCACSAHCVWNRSSAKFRHNFRYTRALFYSTAFFQLLEDTVQRCCSQEVYCSALFPVPLYSVLIHTVLSAIQNSCLKKLCSATRYSALLHSVPPCLVHVYARLCNIAVSCLYLSLSLFLSLSFSTYIYIDVRSIAADL